MTAALAPAMTRMQASDRYQPPKSHLTPPTTSPPFLSGPLAPFFLPLKSMCAHAAGTTVMATSIEARMEAETAMAISE